MIRFLSRLWLRFERTDRLECQMLRSLYEAIDPDATEDLIDEYRRRGHSIRDLLLATRSQLHSALEGRVGEDAREPVLERLLAVECALIAFVPGHEAVHA